MKNLKKKLINIPEIVTQKKKVMTIERKKRKKILK